MSSPEIDDLKDEVEILRTVQSGLIGFLADKFGDSAWQDFAEKLNKSIEANLISFPAGLRKDRIQRKAESYVEAAMTSAIARRNERELS